MDKYDFQVNGCNETETLVLGRKIADVIDFPIIITLVGDLGAGKTTLTRGMLGQLGHLGHVKSPTFSIVEMYEILSLQIAHFDMYSKMPTCSYRQAYSSNLYVKKLYFAHNLYF